MDQIDWKGWLPIILAAIQVIYQALGYHRDTQVESGEGVFMRRRYAIMGLLMLLTWGAVAFDYYDRHRGETFLSQGIFTHEGYTVAKEDTCHATIRTGQIRGFREKYRVALVCGVGDLSVDQLNETRITVSAPFIIVGEVLPVTALVSKEMQDAMRAKAGTEVVVWYEAVLIPQDIEVTLIRRLSDVTKYGGKILNKKYFE